MTFKKNDLAQNRLQEAAANAAEQIAAKSAVEFEQDTTLGYFEVYEIIWQAIQEC